MASKKQSDINRHQKDVNRDQEASNIQNVLYRQVSFWLSIIGVLFGAFIYITGPAGDQDKALSLQDARITSQQETIDRLTKTQQNDTQEVKANVAKLTSKIEEQANEITKLATIIDERIPKKK